MKFNVKVPGGAGENPEEKPEVNKGEQDSEPKGAVRGEAVGSVSSEPVKNRAVAGSGFLKSGTFRLPPPPVVKKNEEELQPSVGNEEHVAAISDAEKLGEAGAEWGSALESELEEAVVGDTSGVVLGDREALFKGSFGKRVASVGAVEKVEKGLKDGSSGVSEEATEEILKNVSAGKRRAALDFSQFNDNVLTESEPEGEFESDSLEEFSELEVGEGDAFEASEEYFDSVDESFGADGEVFESGIEDSFNPLLDGDEDEEEFLAPVVKQDSKPKQQRETIISVPDKPVVSREVQKNFEKKEIREGVKKKARSKKSSKGTQLASEVDRKPLYEVNVSRDGRDSNSNARKVSGSFEEEEVVKPNNRVVNRDGSAKWEVKSGAGKISEDQLDFFGNLSLGKRARVSKQEMREVFGRIDEQELTEGEKTRRKQLMNRALYGDDQLKRGSRRRFTEKDRDVLKFLAMFKYANAKHLARLHQISEEGMLKRLNALKERDLLKKFEMFGAKPLWYLTENGLIVSGMDLPRVKESGITYSMLPHQFVVNHTAGNLWGGGVNVLNLEDFPVKNRKSEKGLPLVGERLVSEYEIQSAFAQIKLTHKAETYKPMITGERDRQFDKWRAMGGASFGSSPELVEGNEFMWVLIPPLQLKLSHHIPDLVVKRERASDGAPKSIAVEIELANKPYESYERTLRAYKYDSLLYEKVIWVVKSRGAARKLEEAAIKLDMWDDERVDIVPIYTEEGIFKGKAEWTL